jgi:hypothetical protein
MVIGLEQYVRSVGSSAECGFPSGGCDCWRCSDGARCNTASLCSTLENTLNSLELAGFGCGGLVGFAVSPITLFQ